MPTGYADLTIDNYAGITLDDYAATPLEGSSSPGGGGESVWTVTEKNQLLTDVAAIKSDMASVKSMLTEIYNRTGTSSFVVWTGTVATAANVTTAKEAVITQGNTAWITATGFATPADVKLTTTTQTVNVTQETVNVTTQIVDLSAMEGTLAAMKEKIDTLPENPVEVTTQTVNVTQETVNVSTQTVDLSGVTQTLGLIKTSTDRIPPAPAAAGNIPTVSDIATAVGRRQIEKNPPLLSMDGLVLAALSSVTEPNAGNPATGTLRVKNPDGSTLGTLTLGVEPAASAKVITAVGSL